MPRIFGFILFIMCGVLGSLGAQEKPFIDLVWVEGGTFMMGADILERKIAENHREPFLDRPDRGGTSMMGEEYLVNKPVTTTVNSFWIGRTEVTQEQWREVMGTNPSYFKGDDLPVEQVSWYDAVEFCNKLSEREGLSPAYSISDTNVTLNSGADGYRLPTEARWEFAARGGNSSRGSTYSGGNSVESLGWISNNSSGRTHPVGGKGANELGIYDMTGNVWEWCTDWYTRSLSGGRDPQGPREASPSSGSVRVVRGGCWDMSAGFVPVSFRDYNTPESRSYSGGLRLVRP